MTSRTRRLVATIVVGSLATACLGSTDPEDDPLPDLTVFGPYRGVEADRFASSMLAPFEEQTGITVRYTGSGDFVVDLRDRIGDGNSPPSIAIVPQPGFVAELVADDHIVRLGDDVRASIDEHYPDSTAGLGEVEGELVGLPIRAAVKSLVWFRPDVFAGRGWSVPTTLDELSSLVDTIVDDPDLAPWCLAVNSGTATGWPATDWVEDLVVRRAGSDAYLQWASGDVGFASSPINAAFEEFSALVLASGHLAGGTVAATQTPTVDVFGGLLADEPACAMVKQADFAASWLPAGTDIGPSGTVDAFVLPGAADGGSTPPLVAGVDLAVQFDDAPEVDALMAHLAGADAGVDWVRAGGYVSPKTSIDPDTYPNEFTRTLATTVLEASELVLDASDVMPLDVGTNLYWQQITQWIVGLVTFDELAATLDEAFVEAVPAQDG